MIAIGSDHGGYQLKEKIKRYLPEDFFRIRQISFLCYYEKTKTECHGDLPEHEKYADFH